MLPPGHHRPHRRDRRYNVFRFVRKGDAYHGEEPSLHGEGYSRKKKTDDYCGPESVAIDRVRHS